MSAALRAPAASARPESAAPDLSPRAGTLVPLVRLLARQAAREFLHLQAANDNQPTAPEGAST